MTKAELIASVAAQTKLKKKDAENAVNAVLDTICATLQTSEKVSLVGFGSFEVHERAARQGRNPRTNEPMTIPASRTASFKAGKSLKDALNG